MQIVFALILMGVSYYIQYSMMPKPKTPKPAQFSDFDIPQIDEGTPQAIIFGDVWQKSWMVLTYGNYRTAAIKKSTGGK